MVDSTVKLILVPFLPSGFVLFDLDSLLLVFCAFIFAFEHDFVPLNKVIFHA